MICTCERGNDDFYQNTLVASLIINPGWTFEPPDNARFGCGPKGHDHGIAQLTFQLLRLCSQRNSHGNKTVANPIRFLFPDKLEFVL